MPNKKLGTFYQIAGAEQKAIESPKDSGKTFKLVEARRSIISASALDSGALSYFPSILCSTALPTRKWPGAEYKRKLGGYRLTVLTPSEWGIPYGPYPRGILAYIAREVTRKKNLELEDPCLIELGKDAREFVAKMNGSARPDYKSIAIFNQQLNSLVNSTIHFTHPVSQSKDGPEYDANHYSFTDAVSARRESPLRLWTPGGDREEHSKAEFLHKLRITDRFRKDLADHGVPIDDRALKALWPNCLHIDVYVWIVYRGHWFRGRPLTLQWSSLQEQFGSRYTGGVSRTFKLRFREAVHAVKQVYHRDPDCIRMTEDGETVRISIKHPNIARSGASPNQLALW